MRVCKRWDDESHETVAKEYPTADLNALARKLGRTVAAVKRYAQLNGIKRPRKSTKGYRYVQRNPRQPKERPVTPEMLIVQAMRSWL